MKTPLKTAFLSTVPVLTGYLVLGFGFGIILHANGFGVGVAFAMSLLIYAGSMQYAAIGLMTGGASLLTLAVTTLMVNARHIFYGISMLGRYKDAGKAKPYLIFALTDETYSLVCQPPKELTGKALRRYELLVTLFDHAYWVTGSVLGAAAGALIPISSEGIDFALTALFLTVFTEQWLSAKDHSPALIGLGASAACLLLFGSGNFLIPAMLVIALLLCIRREESGDE